MQWAAPKVFALSTKYVTIFRPPPYADFQDEVVSMRAYCLDVDGQKHFAVIPVHRYPIHGICDIPVPSWTSDPNVNARGTQITIVDHQGRLSSFYVLYSHAGNAQPRNDSITGIVPDIHWTGPVVVFKIASSTNRRLVNMRRGDDTRSHEVIRR